MCFLQFCQSIFFLYTVYSFDGFMGNVCKKLLQLDTAIPRRLTWCKIIIRYGNLEKKRWAIKLSFGGVGECKPLCLVAVYSKA